MSKVEYYVNTINVPIKKNTIKTIGVNIPPGTVYKECLILFLETISVMHTSIAKSPDSTAPVNAMVFMKDGENINMNINGKPIVKSELINGLIL